MRQLIGYVPVDSGQIVIIDPCYLQDWRHGDYDPDTAGEPRNDYEAVCRLTVGDSNFGEIERGTVHGVASRTAYGDGVYPVYAELDRVGGRPLKLTIYFEGGPDDEN